jgi:hypothetical protein
MIRMLLNVACPHCAVTVPCLIPVIAGTNIAVVGGSELAELHAHMWAEHVDAEVH